VHSGSSLHATAFASVLAGAAAAVGTRRRRGVAAQGHMQAGDRAAPLLQGTGDQGFDPLGFSSATGSPLEEVEEYLNEVFITNGLPAFDKQRWYREAELMHGRVAMLASLNIILREAGKVVLPDETLDAGGKLQFLEVMSVLELYRGYRLLFNTDALAGDLGVGMGAGDALAPDMTAEELAQKQFRELQNGRLAMLGFACMAVQHAYTGNYIMQDSQIKQLQNMMDSAATLPGDAQFSTVLAAVGMLLAGDGIRRLSSPAPQAQSAGMNSIARKAINLFAVRSGVQAPKVPLPSGVVAGGSPQQLQLTEAQVAQFEEDGVIMIKGGLKGWVDFLRAVTEHQIEHPHVWSLIGRMSGLYDYIQRNMWMTNDGYRDFLYYSPLGHVVSQLARSPEVRVSTDMLLVNPNKGFGWHQDNQNGPIDFPDAVRWWTAMDSCGQDGFGAPEYLLGSHRNQTVSKDAVFVNLKDGDLSGFQRRTLFMPEPGDLIIWDARTIHRIVAPPGQQWVEGTQRRAFGGTMAKSGATYLDKGGASAISDLAGHEQVGGEPLGGPYFPRIYPARVEEEEALRASGGVVGRSPRKIADLGVKLASNAGKYISFTKVVGKKS